MLPDLHNVFPAGTQREHGVIYTDRKQPGALARSSGSEGGKANSIRGNNCTEIIENVSLIVINIDSRGLLTLRVMTNTDR